MVKNQAVLLTAILAACIQKSRACLEKSDTMRCQHHISSCPIKNTGWHQCCHLKLLLHTQPDFLYGALAALTPLVTPRNCLHVAFSGKVLMHQFCLWICSNCQNSNEGCVHFKILQLTEKSLSWQITLISNLHSSLLLLPQIAQALWQWLQSLMITTGLLSALQQHTASGSLFKLVKHARSFTPITLLFSNFSGKKVLFTSFIILLMF